MPTVGSIHIEFDEPLSFFTNDDVLVSDKTGEDRAVKDLIESLGVPHCEVMGITVNGNPKDLDYLVQPNDQIQVTGWTRPVDVTRESILGRPLLDEPRFVADVHLGKLVRYLRMLGLDCHYSPPWDDELLAEVSANENRIMLTRDVGLLKRGCIDHGMFLRSDQAIEQARQVLSWLHLDPFIRQFTRCPSCNGVLNQVEKSAIEHLIPAGTRRSYQLFYQCADCAKVFWKGAHFSKLQGILDKIHGE